MLNILRGASMIGRYFMANIKNPYCILDLSIEVLGLKHNATAD